MESAAKASWLIFQISSLCYPGVTDSTPRQSSYYNGGTYYLPFNRSFFSPSYSLTSSAADEDDPILNEIVQPYLKGARHPKPEFGSLPTSKTFPGGEKNSSSVLRQNKGNNLLGYDFDRGKRGALALGLMMNCATGCDPLHYNGYGCFCGFAGAGDPMDDIDMCCKMHDWCYSTSSCKGLAWHLPYFVPFKWKCNGGAPYCIPGKTKQSGRDSCSHQLCECDRQFAMCLNHHLPCPRNKLACRSPTRLVQNLVTGIADGLGLRVKPKGAPRPHSHGMPKEFENFRKLPYPFG